MTSAVPASSGGRVFLSYSRRDSTFCLRIAEDLKRIGVDAWIDQLDIPPGAPWDRSVETALRDASTVVVLLSPDSVRSESVLDEVSFAIDSADLVIPIVVRECVIPLRLRRLQYLDFTQDYEAALQQLVAQLRPPPAEDVPAAPVLRTVWVSQLVDRTRLTQQLGDRAAADLLRRHASRARAALAEHGGREIVSSDRLAALFERPIQAVHFALTYHRILDELSQDGAAELTAGVGIHLGEVLVHDVLGHDAHDAPKPVEIEGLVKAMAVDLATLALGRQTLLSQAAFDTARRSAKDAAPVDGPLQWLAHGEFLPRGLTTPMAVFEVGLVGVAPLTVPHDSPAMRRVESSQTLPGWRPAAGLTIPRRQDWTLNKKLGEGGFGEVWLASHGKTGAQHVFKFCFDAQRLRALKREITLFRLLKETLGEREDIARILDWDFDQEPYFIESEYTTGGDLKEWAANQGGIERVAPAARLEIAAQVGDALAAAHSVGVLHKDIKPGNILIYMSPDGQPKVRLTDFGIGLITDESHLLASGITVLSMTELKAADTSSSGGTRLYMAPEVVEGKTASVQADVYALGVLLYQLVAGDLSKSLAPGWERDVEDELLREVIAWAVDGAPEQRLADGGRLARRLRTLERRRAELAAEQQAREAAARDRAALEQSRKRRRQLLVALAGLLVIACGMGLLTLRVFQEKARADREAQATQQVADFLIDLFEVSAPEQSRGESPTVREILERGASAIGDELEDQPLVRARIQDTVGSIYQRLGWYREADELLQQALTTRRSVHEPSHPDVIDTLARLAANAYYQAEFPAALEYFRDILAIQQEALGPHHLDVADSLNNLAILHDTLGDPAAALEHYQRALAISEKQLGPDHPNVARTLNNLAIIYREQENYVEAQSLSERAVAIAEQALGPDHPELAKFLTVLARIHHARGQSADAERLARRALEIREPSLDADHPDLATSLHLLAEIRLAQQDYAAAEPLFLRARSIRETALAPDHPKLAESLKGLANLRRDQGQYAEAETLYRQAATLLEAAFGPDHPDLALLDSEVAALDRVSTEEASQSATASSSNE
ncbi:MAG: tetratricopeptide repeat protein [Acidobacteriota bacterium]